MCAPTSPGCTRRTSTSCRPSTTRTTTPSCPPSSSVVALPSRRPGGRPAALGAGSRSTPSGEPVAIATFGPGRDEDRPDFELHHIYTLRSTHGTGLGQRLLDTAIGTRAAYLWILDDNPRAERFYVRNGFGPDGTSMLCGPTWHHKPMFRMHRPDHE